LKKKKEKEMVTTKAAASDEVHHNGFNLWENNFDTCSLFVFTLFLAWLGIRKIYNG
jgi:hypothetical protein